MILILIVALIIPNYSFSQNNNKSYYFKMGKSTNEFRVNNRVYYLNHNITDYDYTHRNGGRTQQSEDNYESTYYIDEEWNYNHENLTKTELPKFIFKFYEKIASDEKTTYRILFNVNQQKPNDIIKFNLESLKANEAVLDAEFYFFWPLEATSEIYGQSVVLRLYQFEKQPQGDFNKSAPTENPDIHKLFNVIYISKAQKGWQIFKIKKPINNWLNGEDNLGLLLTISSYDDNKLIEVFNDTNEGVYRSFAAITVQSNETQEQINIQEEQDTSPSCQKREWTVSFKKLHWDKFIIAPDSFPAYDCVGKCLNPQSDRVNHVKLLRVFRRRSSCCIPLDYLPLPIIFYDKLGNVVIKSFANMIVSKCGCR